MLFPCSTPIRSVVAVLNVPHSTGGGVLLLALGLFLATVGRVAAQSSPSPPVEVREVRVAKDTPNETFPDGGTTVALWVKDSLGTFASVVDAETDLKTFQDDAGTDLIAAHRTAVDAWKQKRDSLAQEGRMVHSGRSRSLYETEGFEPGAFSEGAPGFYFRVESWGLPASDATQLRVTGTVTYLLGRDETETKRFSDTVLSETDRLTLGTHSIRITDARAKDDSQQFSLDAPLSITSFEVKDQEGESFGGIGLRMNGRPVVNVPKRVFDASATVVVEYTPVRERTVEIDRRVSLGL